MDWIQGWALIVQLVKEVGEGAAETCFHSRVERLNDAIQHNFLSLLSACSISGVYRQSKRKRELHLGDVTVSFSGVLLIQCLAVLAHRGGA